ncbi:MAG: hypothetical protein AAFY71_26750 [Bacteroidota bacterium]
MRIPWLTKSKPLQINVTAKEIKQQAEGIDFAGDLELIAHRPIWIKTIVFRLSLIDKHIKQPSHLHKDVSAKAVLLDRELEPNDRLEMPIIMFLQHNHSNMKHKLALWIDIDTDPGQPRSEWTGDFSLN